MADSSPDSGGTTITGLLSGALDFLKNPKRLAQLANESPQLFQATVALLKNPPPWLQTIEGGAFGAMDPSGEASARYWDAQGRRRASDQAAAIEKRMNLPPGALSTLGAAAIPKPMATTAGVYEVGPFGAAPVMGNEGPLQPAVKPTAQRPLFPPAGARSMYNPATGKYEDIPEGERTPQKPTAPPRGLATTIVDPTTNKPRRVLVYPNGSVTDIGEAPASGGAATGTAATDIAQGIIDGEQPPKTEGLFRFAGPVRAELARQHYPLAKATLDWQAVNKHIATLNGPQQMRLRQSIAFAYDSLDKIEELYGQWKKLGGASGYRVFNKANLAASKQVPGEMGATAQALESQINDQIEAMANVYMGGNSPTDKGLALAGKNLAASWNEETFKKQLDLMRTNLRIRRNSILQSQPVGGSPDNPYTPPAPPVQTTNLPKAPAAGPPPGPRPMGATHWSPTVGYTDADGRPVQ